MAQRVLAECETVSNPLARAVNSWRHRHAISIQRGPVDAPKMEPPPHGSREGEEFFTDLDSVPLGKSSSAGRSYPTSRIRWWLPIIIVAFIACGPGAAAGVVFHHLGTPNTGPVSFLMKPHTRSDSRGVPMCKFSAVSGDEAQQREGCPDAHQAGVVGTLAVLSHATRRLPVMLIPLIFLPFDSPYQATKAGIAVAVLTWACFTLAGWCVLRESICRFLPPSRNPRSRCQLRDRSGFGCHRAPLA